MRHATSRAKISFLIHDVSRMRRTLFDAALKPLGITRAQWWVLGNISRHAEEGMIQTELANVLDTGKVTVGGLINRLEEAGMIYRKTDPADRRGKRIYITDKGNQVLDQVAETGDQLDDVLFAGMSDKQLEQTSEIMTLMKANIRAALKGA